MQIIYVINVLLISLISGSYYSKSIERKKINNNINNLLQESDSFYNNETTTSSLSEGKFTTLQLQNHKDVQYIGDIYIGNPSTKMTVIFDTGSNILWVPSSDCPTCRKTVNRYNSKLSQTSKELNSTKSITYAIGFVQGNFCYDIVSLNSKGDCKAKDLLFLNVNEETNLTGTVGDGVFGLGIYNENDPKISLIETLYNQKQINEAAFSFYLLGTNNISRLFIGDILKNEYILNLFKNKIKECNVNKDSVYWECYAYNGLSISNAQNNKKENFYTNSTFIFDTGSSYTLIPKKDFDNIFNFLNLEHNCRLNKYNELLCECNNENEFGNVEIYFDKNNKFVLDLKNMINLVPGTHKCHFQIMKENYDLEAWILGDSSLRKNLISFNLYERKISFIQNISGIIDENNIAKSKWIKNATNLFYYILGVIILIICICIIFALFKN